MRKKPAEIMDGKHWAIITMKTTYHEGDERSRTNPGHGYPAHSTSDLVYEPFDTEAEAMDRLQQALRTPGRGSPILIEANPYQVTVERKITLKGEGDA